jgi:hypothetical protein
MASAAGGTDKVELPFIVQCDFALAKLIVQCDKELPF